MGYTKLFSEIVMSTVWREKDTTRLVWITMLALRNRHHVVEGSVPGLADCARVSIKACRAAIKVLSDPDPDSRSQELEGRRIQEVDGGWFIINGEKYRRKMSEDERREKNAIYQKNHRERKKSVSTQSDISAKSAQTEEETETKSEKKEKAASGKRMPTGRSGLPDSEWIALLKEDKTYHGIDIDRELGKMHQWCSIRQLTPTRRRFINWLNRSDKPMNGDRPSMSPQHRQNRINYLNEKKQKTNRQIKDPNNPPSWAVAELEKIDDELKKL